MFIDNIFCKHSYALKEYIMDSTLHFIYEGNFLKHTTFKFKYPWHGHLPGPQVLRYMVGGLLSDVRSKSE